MLHPRDSVEVRQSYRGSLAILTTLFFMWGFITSLNDILIPHLKAVFTLNYAEAMLVQFCFFTAYFVVSIPSGYLVDKIVYKGGMFRAEYRRFCLRDVLPCRTVTFVWIVFGRFFYIGFRCYFVASCRQSLCNRSWSSGNRV